MNTPSHEGARPRWARLQALFEEGLAQPTAERARWLEDACPDDPTLRAQAAGMLAAHFETGGILDRPRAHSRDAADATEDLGPRLERALDGRYAVERELGRGGMGVVYLARERKHARDVVIKVLAPAAAAAVGTRRFEREVEIAARLAHPHIVPLLDSGEANGLRYFVMPRLEGETLRARLHRRAGRPDALPPAEALALLRDVAEALAHAHAHGVVHRDVKPENVLCAGGHAYLLDFGIAKRAAGPHAAGPTEHDTDAGAALGTPAYMAPEQWHGGPVDARADVYAWGMLAHELLTGRLPGAGEDRDARVEMPRGIAPLLHACLAVAPARRPADGAAIVAALDGSATAPPPAVRRPLARRAAGIAVATAVLAVSAALALLARRRDATAADAAPTLGLVAVGALVNETGDGSLDAWGRLAGDWFTQGLQETGRVDVVPWPTALAASGRPSAGRPGARGADVVARLSAETGARTVVTGAYYRVGDSLSFHVEVTDARSGRLLVAPRPVVVARDSAHVAACVLRDRIMAALAITSDDRTQSIPEFARRPPTFAAYHAFDAALARFNAQEYGAAATEFRAAASLDTSFAAPLLYAATSYWNDDRFAAADTMIRLLRRRAAADPRALGAQDRAWSDFLVASMVGDGARALDAVRRAAALGPATRASYSLAREALQMGRPAEALAALDRLDPDRGDMRGWSSYWTQRTHALHLLGRHDDELAAARALRTRFPQRTVGLALEARALAALGRQRALDSLFDAAGALPPATYWSLGAAMVIAGEELIAHGDVASGRRRVADGARWLEAQLALTPNDRAHRYWLGSAQYDLGRWRESAVLFAALAHEFPERLGYRGMAALSAARAGDGTADARLGAAAAHERGTHAAYRARLLAVRGRRAEASALLAAAIADGVTELPWLHAAAHADLAPLGESAVAFARRER